MPASESRSDSISKSRICNSIKLLTQARSINECYNHWLRDCGKIGSLIITKASSHRRLVNFKGMIYLYKEKPLWPIAQTRRRLTSVLCPGAVPSSWSNRKYSLSPRKYFFPGMFYLYLTKPFALTSSAQAINWLEYQRDDITRKLLDRWHCPRQTGLALQKISTLLESRSILDWDQQQRGNKCSGHKGAFQGGRSPYFDWGDTYLGVCICQTLQTAHLKCCIFLHLNYTSIQMI